MREISEKAKLIRKLCLTSTSEAGSGHPTSCLSAADIAAVLFEKYFRYDLKNPLNPTNDRFILSKGHAAPLLYTLFAMSGAFPLKDLLKLRQFGSPLEGHPTPNFVFSDAATGSLGQGLSVAAGLAYISKVENLKYRTFALLGDGELAEGQVWEAANFASYYKLNNLIAIADINRLGQSQETMFAHHVDEYMARFRAFGFEVIGIDGHDLGAIDSALQDAMNNESDKPYVIIAKTYKGRGVSFLENKDGWHGKPLKKEDLEKALQELGDVNDALRFVLPKPDKLPKKKEDAVSSPIVNAEIKQYPLGELVATRDVYGLRLSQLATSDKRIYSLDADVKNSTFSLDFQKTNPERFVECFIAEQNMVGVAVGMARIGRKPFVSTFSAFLTRAFDQIRMAGVGKANVAFVGSHAGVSIGEDGASQMGLEDMAMFSTVPGSIIFHPSDALSTEKIIPLLQGHTGISYLRTLRPKTAVLYQGDEEFVVGGSKILKKSTNDVLTVAACGITVHEALKAYEMLKAEGIYIRVADCYSVKPVDGKTLQESLKKTKKNILITVEDHSQSGGLGDQVLSALSKTGAIIEKMAVTKTSRSGKMDELLRDAGIDSESIVKKVKSLIAS